MEEEQAIHQIDAHASPAGNVRRPMFISYAATSAVRVPEQRFLVASLSLAERRQQSHSSGDLDSSKKRHDFHSPRQLERNVEVPLLTYCRSQKWDLVMQRCIFYPEESIPIQYARADSQSESVPYSSKIESQSPKKFDHGSYLGVSRAPMSIYNDTSLGLVCASEFHDSAVMCKVIKALITACPSQIQASQRLSGHTPLRDAVTNPSCTPECLALLIQADLSLPGTMCSKAINMKDRDGLEPIDHLITGVHVVNSSSSLSLLGQFLREIGNFDRQAHHRGCSCAVTSSPLIRLLSMGTSYGLNVSSRQGQQSACSNARCARILECARLIVEGNGSHVHTRARSTQCTALHVALRNYGDYLPLIQYLFDQDTRNFMAKQRNLYGDLPLHVASSVGVPDDVLRLVVERTLSGATSQPDSPHPLIWSTNISGYTAVDLEWMRHIEGGRGFFESRVFYPLEACGIRWHCSRQDEFYRDLLEEAVTQVLESDGINRQQKKRESFGIVLHRILFLVQVAHEGVLPGPVPCDMIHAASSLSRLPGPCLPKALLDLILWMDPEKLFCADRMGRSPLHYAVMPTSACDAVTLTTRRKDHVVVNDHLCWVKFLLEKDPMAAQKSDKTGRLPLHYLLAGRSISNSECWTSDGRGASSHEMATACNHVVSLLVEAFPESVDIADAQSRLFPFMKAAQNPATTLDVVFGLLQRSPVLAGLGVDT